MREGSGHTARVQSPLGSALKKRRLHLGLSQEELANRAGLHRTYITDVERGSRNPSLETIQKLARALEVQLSDVFLQIESGPDALPPRPGADAVEILVVEDDQGDGERVLDALKSNNLTNTVHVVRDGADALDFVFSTGSYLSRAPLEIPRLILLDLNLPGIGCLEVLRRIRADGRTRAIPVAVLTPSRSDGDLEACTGLGVEVFLSKPVDFIRFREAAQKLGFRWKMLGPDS
jgi:two-component system, response regulator